MRRLWFPLVVALAAASVPPLLGQTPDAAQVISSAREALGGEKKLSAVRTFTATGRTRQVRGNNLVPIEFEINCELPDKFVRKDEIPAQDTDPTTRGFNGDTLIQFRRLALDEAVRERADRRRVLRRPVVHRLAVDRAPADQGPRLPSL